MGASAYAIGQDGLSAQLPSPLPPAAPPATTGDLVYKPRMILREPHVVEITARSEDPNAVPWGFWGLVIVSSVAFGLIVLKGRSGMWAIWDLAIPILFATIGVVLWRYGAFTSRRERSLASLDMSRRVLSVVIGSNLQRMVPLSEITEIVFGMSHIPISGRSDNARVHVFSVLVRDAGDRLIPVVEATPDKGPAYEIAKMIAKSTGLQIRHVGDGVRL